MFIYNPTLILYGVDLGTATGVAHAVFVFIVATFAMLLFAAATQGYFLARSRIHESAMLLLVAFTFFVPNFWLNQVQPRFIESDPAAFEQTLAEADPGGRIRLRIEGPDFNTGDMTQTTLSLVVPEAEGQARMDETGLMLRPNAEGAEAALEEPMFGTPIQEDLSSFDFYSDDPVRISQVLAPNDNRLPAQIFYIPALLLLGLVIVLQRRRQTKPAF